MNFESRYLNMPISMIVIILFMFVRLRICRSPRHNVLDGPVRPTLPLSSGAHYRRWRFTLLRSQKAREDFVEIFAQVWDRSRRVPQGQQETADRRSRYRLGGNRVPESRRASVRLHSHVSDLHKNESQGIASEHCLRNCPFIICKAIPLN